MGWQASFAHELSAEESKIEYGNEVRYVDREIGRLVEGLDRRNWIDDSLIVFTADHGESLGEHNLGGHIHQLYETLLHVPLFFVSPGRIPEGMVIDQPASLVDVLPTIAEIAGLPIPAGIRGRSLVPLISGSADAWVEKPHFSVTARPQANSNLESVVLGGWKLIRNQDKHRDALFNLLADPCELNDVAADFPDRVTELSELLDKHHAEPISDAALNELDDESRAQLEALGYLTRPENQPSEQ